MKEKREFPRVDKILPIKLSDKEFDILTETKNISANGAYFPTSKALEIMAKFNVVLLIPFKKNKNKTIKKISCCGTVVRCEYANDNTKYPYRTGIYFKDLKDCDKKTLRSYINSFLKKDS